MFNFNQQFPLQSHNLHLSHYKGCFHISPSLIFGGIQKIVCKKNHVFIYAAVHKGKGETTDRWHGSSITMLAGGLRGGISPGIISRRKAPGGMAVKACFSCTCLGFVIIYLYMVIFNPSSSITFVDKLNRRREATRDVCFMIHTKQEALLPAVSNLPSSLPHATWSTYGIHMPPGSFIVAR